MCRESPPPPPTPEQKLHQGVVVPCSSAIELQCYTKGVDSKIGANVVWGGAGCIHKGNGKDGWHKCPDLVLLCSSHLLSRAQFPRLLLLLMEIGTPLENLLWRFRRIEGLDFHFLGVPQGEIFGSGQN